MLLATRKRTRVVNDNVAININVKVQVVDVEVDGDGDGEPGELSADFGLVFWPSRYG
jgi:hypothetical protein